MLVPDEELHPTGHESQLVESVGDVQGKFQKDMVDVWVFFDVLGQGDPMAHGLDGDPFVQDPHPGGIQPLGVVLESEAVDAQKSPKEVRIGPGQIPDGVDPITGEFLPCGPTDPQEGVGRQGVDLLLPVLFPDEIGGVPVGEVRGQFGEDLVEAETHGNGEAQFLPDGSSDLFSHFFDGSEEPLGAAEVEPAFVDPEGFDLFGEAVVDLPGLLGEADVFFEVGRDDQKIGAFQPGLPDGFPGPDPFGFGFLGFGQHDPVAFFAAAADRKGQSSQVGVEHGFHGGVVVVHVAVEDPSFHLDFLLSSLYTWFMNDVSYIVC